MYKWIVVGGGIQGITIVAFLRKQRKASIDEIAIIDPHEKPLENWKRCTDRISMPYLRSPVVHHLDVHPLSLQMFGKNTAINETAAFYGRFKRPSLAMFNEHCDELITNLELKKGWVQGRVYSAERTENKWKVELQNGQELKGENLILAIGISEQPVWPDWSKRLKTEANASVYHIFESDLPKFEGMPRPFTIIGGGITSAHLAAKLSSMYPGEVTLLKRHPFRLHDFDSDPAWLGPKNQLSFSKLSCYQKRREKIKQARHKGSLPRDVYMKLMRSIRNDELLIKDGQVQHALVKNKEVHLYDERDQLIHQTGTVLLATGFQPSLPGKQWLMPMIEKHGLPCAECGYPVVSKSLKWGPGLYVIGALAELEMGPIARNISGARQAAERIVSSL